MNKIFTVLGALTIASAPIISLNVGANKTQKLTNTLKPASKKAVGGVSNSFFDICATDNDLIFSLTLSNDINYGFTGFLDEISFNLSDYNYHAWPIYFFQWLDDDDFNAGTFPELSNHTKHGFYNWPFAFNYRFETIMGHFGSFWDDKTDTAFKTFTSYGKWGSFGQSVDNAYNKAFAAHQAAGIGFYFAFHYDSGYSVKRLGYSIYQS